MKIAQVYEQQKNFWAGVLMVLLLSLAVVLSYQGKKHSKPSNSMHLYATYNKADGITVGSPIRLAGIRVGQVTDAQLDKFYRVQLTFALPKDIKLPTDTAAMIETDGLVGSKSIELLPGAEEETMQDGDQFMYTQDVLLLDELMTRFVDWIRLKKGVSETELIKKGEG